MISLSDDDVLYKDLLERLEISIIDLSQVLNVLLRFDAEYYSHENLHYQKIISSATGKTIGNLGGILDCSAFYPSITGFYSYNRNLIPFLRVNEIADGLVSLTDNTVFLPQKVLDANSKTITSAYPGDIIIAKGGNTLAKVGLVTDEYPKYATCRDVIVLRTNTLKNINKFFLWTFLHSNYGQGLIWRAATQTGQPHITLPAILNLHIPEFSSEIQNMCEKLYLKSISCKKKANILYSSAEALLIHELDFDTWQPSRDQISLRSFKDITEAGRIDAEYYQPKYDEIKAKLQKMGDGTVETECILVDKNFSPEKTVEYKYIELANIGTSGEITGCTVGTGAELPSRARRIVHSGDIIISSIEGSLQSCALISDEYDGALCSTGFYVLSSEKINSETLLTLFKSEPIQALLKQQCSGTILTAFGKDGLLSIPIPKIRKDLQLTIKKNIVKSYELRQKSAQLLKASKHAVEIAIERSEAAATEYLNNTI